MWSFARYDLKLTNKQFWDLTPKEFRKLSDRYVNAQDILDIRSGVIAASVSNAMSKKDNGEAFSAKDFFPDAVRRIQRQSGKTSEDRRVQSTEEQIVAMQTWMTVFKQHENAGAFAQKAPANLPGVSEILDIEVKV